MSESRKYVLEFPAHYKPKPRAHPAYGQWAMMLTRCRNRNSPKYKDYGARGIKVCARWERGEHGMTGFECFMMDMGNKPSPEHSLDRIDNDGNYERENCRWATAREQARNRRSTHFLTYKGERMSMLSVSEKFGISYFRLRNRIMRGWSAEDAIEKPRNFFDFRKSPRGEALSRLTEQDVKTIRAIYAAGGRSMQSIGVEFGISAANVCMMVNRKTWAHVA